MISKKLYICTLNNRGRVPQFNQLDYASKIRLQRHGKKGNLFYWIVAADARSKEMVNS